MIISLKGSKKDFDWLLNKELEKDISEIDTSFVDFLLATLTDVPTSTDEEVSEGIKKILARYDEERKSQK